MSVLETFSSIQTQYANRENSFFKTTVQENAKLVPEKWLFSGIKWAH
jgi:hypothetical protein